MYVSTQLHSTYSNSSSFLLHHPMTTCHTRLEGHNADDLTAISEVQAEVWGEDRVSTVLLSAWSHYLHRSIDQKIRIELK